MKFGQEVFDQLAVDELVGRTRQPADEQRQRIGENSGQQSPVDLRYGAVDGGEDYQPRHGTGDKVGDEDPTHAEPGGKKPGEAECHGQDDIEHDAHRLEPDEQHRPPLLAQP